MESLSTYIKSIEKLPLISKDEEKRLSTIIQTHENSEEVDKAVEALVLANLRLVIHRAKKFSNRYPKIDLMNLISDGNLCLMKAARNYEYKKKATFGTYATFCLDKCFFQTITANDIIKIPSNQNDKLTKLSRLQANIRHKLNDEETMEILDIGEESLELLKSAKSGQYLSSLDEAIKVGEDRILLINLIPDKSAPATERHADMNSLGEYLNKKMSILTDRERDILNIAYLEGCHFTYSEISEKIGLSRERCRQLLIRAKRKMRRFIGDMSNAR